MRKLDIELSVGLFIIAGLICLGYLSIKLGRMEVLGGKGYEIYARFTNTGGLKVGASVAIAGVEVGRVKSITLEDYQARIVMNLDESIKIQEDAIASIKTRGLIGEKYVEITPGGSDQIIEPGGRIRETQPAVDFEELISNFVFGKI
ncbi:MAG: outer membrane lipid asymmetry maintenance protein MlaD [Deltaproteobacteria bacterium]|nr:outer membrane lipid asymmetry maintenance protein MlaD [Deltaproteobacteria bacterium]MBW2016589.1 outer membrane lipid asymmetry maintenance protein MlaD [Deltaproteobacteria bacterium]MBW2129505.1 outer membrane lipid asymmetry maintenance protein MlaD [Deltaproteobacteria bacterium]MBW2304818.1 outer membrane lipid asymmetry maintenance protein MlaD [Deltaproteobacteria bacterium]